MSKPFNPVDFFESDDEIVDFLVECWFDDPEGLTYLRACEFVADALADTKTFARLVGLSVRAITKRESARAADGGRDASA